MKPQILLLSLLLLTVRPAVRAEVQAPESRADAATGATLATQTPGRAEKLLEELAAGFKALGSYTVTFEIAAGGTDDIAGSYTVRDGGYLLTIGEAEVFFDGGVRYEVDHARREVTVNSVDTTSRNILDNPIGAFDFLDGLYRPTLLGERDGHAAVLLTPTDGNAAAGAVTVTLSLNPVRPLRVAYDYDGEQITVSVLSVEPFAGTLRRFDPKACAGYEMIDFR